MSESIQTGGTPVPPTLYGVGVGPGAPDLMTLRAVRVLRSVPVVAIPRRNEFVPSLAWDIAKPNIGEIPGQERLFLTFPMTKDPELLRPAWNAAFEQIGDRLNRGLDVAFITEGDPLVYSTFIYLLKAAPQRWPGLRVEVVPGVTSITAVPASILTPVADGQERIAVLPATYGVEDLTDVLQRFDTIILMKVGSVMPAVIEALERTDLIGQAVYVSKATTSQQRIIHDVRSLRNDRCDYFSMVVVARRDRSGVLEGLTATRALEVPS
jgi:precorrin-2/cobalt-factor-2 C20-methyltransferase